MRRYHPDVTLCAVCGKPIGREPYIFEGDVVRHAVNCTAPLRRQLNRFGRMVVIDTDQGAGRKYRCPCGWQGWSAWGHALRHAKSCPKAAIGAEPGGAT
jgi:hypothetical protein